MQSKLIIPVYLNQRIVFDLLAMLEGGISHITRIASVGQNSENDERRYGAEFGLNKALSTLLKINVSGDRKKTSESSDTTKTDEERVHTPASLFYRLRNRLLESGDLRVLDGRVQPNEHDLVEFTAHMSRNPLIQTMDSFIAMMGMVASFEEPKKSGQNRPKENSPQIFKQMKAFSDSLKSGDTVDMIAEDIIGEQRALVTVETEYLNDPTMADLVDGRFVIVGKVVRNVSQSDSISLLRKSALTVMPPAIIQEMTGKLKDLSQSGDLNLPHLDLEIQGPAFQIIPIAIFA